MNEVTAHWISFSEVRTILKTHCLRQAEIPMGHYISLPLPTFHAGRPGYASFASPSRHRRGDPALIGPPDRHWLLDARDGRLLLYALTSIEPLLTTEESTSVHLPEVSGSVGELREQLASLEAQLESLTAPFFAQQTVSDRDRARLAKALRGLLPPPLLGWHNAIAPDFFRWVQV